MRRASRTIGALALLAVVGTALAWAILSDRDSGETSAASIRLEYVPQEPAHGEPRLELSDRGSSIPLAHVPQERAHERPRLELSDRGQPIVWLRKGAQIPVHAAPGGEVVDALGWRTPFRSRTVLSVFRRVGRWVGVPTPLLSTGRLGWVKLNPSKLRAGSTPYAIDVDLSQRAAQLRRGDRVLRSFAVTVGAPGTDTPTGRFAVTDTFRGNLNPAYGCCAIATTARQLNLPSGWLGGDRIAIHGTAGPLGVAASSGCVRAADEDVSALVDRVWLGSPVIIRQ
jgi:L,D-transpeptidase catalytic domain